VAGLATEFFERHVVHGDNQSQARAGLRPMNKSFRLKYLVIFACLHALVAIGLFAYGFDLSAVDGVEPSRAKQFAFTAAGVLMLPGRLIWTEWASKNLPNVLEWFLLIANSILWGAVIATVVQKEWSRK
jgi:hypothetical protein